MGAPFDGSYYGQPSIYPMSDTSPFGPNWGQNVSVYQVPGLFCLLTVWKKKIKK